MRIYTELESFYSDPENPLILGLGNFDGLHLGHKALIEHVILEASAQGGTAAVFTFSEHPQEVLHPGTKPNLLTAMNHRLWLFDQLGVDVCFLTHFTSKFSQMEPEEFVHEILVRELGVSQVCLGYNARFGHGRQGDGALMRKFADEFDFQFEEMKAVQVDGQSVSSTGIRQFIEKGDFEKASRCLGRPYSLFAEVVKGEGRGKKLGFPTANLNIKGLAMPPTGVYPVKVRRIDISQKRTAEENVDFRSSEPGAWVKGVLNYGARPTFKGEGGLVAEVHLFGFKADLYGATLEVQFYPRIREERRFEGAEELKKQVKKDVLDAQKLLSA